MEKYRFYVDLPGDIWEEGTFMDLIKLNMSPLIRADGRIEHQDMLRLDQVHVELVVMDPRDACAYLPFPRRGRVRIATVPPFPLFPFFFSVLFRPLFWP